MDTMDEILGLARALLSRATAEETTSTAEKLAEQILRKF